MNIQQNTATRKYSPQLVRNVIMGTLAFLVMGAAQVIVSYRYTHRRVISYDCSVSVLSAAGHQGDIARGERLGEWQPAGAILSMWRPTLPVPYRGIAQDLSQLDTHPPLYFWVLGTVGGLLGSTLGAALLISMAAIFIAGGAIFCTARKCGTGNIAALGAAFAWVAGYSTLSLATDVRHYCFLGMMVSLHILAAVCVLGDRRWRNWLFFVATAWAGMLTHYHFCITLFSSCCAMGAWYVFQRKGLEIFRLVSAAILATMLFVIFHPTFLGSFTRYEGTRQAFLWENIGPRQAKASITFLSMLVPGASHMKLPGWLLILAGMVLVVILVAAAIYAVRRLNDEERRICAPRSGYVVLVWLSTMIISWGLYVSHISPEITMTSKYMMIWSPVLFVVIAIILRPWMSRLLGRYLLAGWVACHLAMSAILTIRDEFHVKADERQAVTVVDGPVIMGCNWRGMIGQVVMQLPADVPVFVSSEDYILTHGISSLSDKSRILYVWNPASPGAVREGDVMRWFSAQGFIGAKEYAKGLGGVGRAIQFERPGSKGAAR